MPYTVIGIMPAGFRTTWQSRELGFWTVYAGNSSRERERELGYELVARLSPGATVEQARREIDGIGSGVEGWGKEEWRLGLVPLKEEVIGNRAKALLLLMAAAAGNSRFERRLAPVQQA